MAGRRDAARGFILVEYVGDLPPAPTADIRTLTRGLVLVEHTQQSQREIDRSLALVEYTEQARHETARSFALVEYTGDLPSAPTADIDTATRGWVLVEYREQTRRQADRAFVLVELDDAQYIASPTGGVLKRWNGSVWVNAVLKRWNGSAWVGVTLRRWDGSQWLDVDATGV